MGYSVDIVGTNLNVLQEELLIMVMLHQRYTITHSMLDQPVHLLMPTSQSLMIWNSKMKKCLKSV